MRRSPIMRWFWACRGDFDDASFPADPLVPIVVRRRLRGDPLIRVTERHRAPSFELNDAEGRLTRTEEFRGRVVLINFWATWCVPCKEEIPCFDQFSSAYRDQGFEVLGISMDARGWEVVRPYMEKIGMRYHVVIRDARTAYKYGQADSFQSLFCSIGRHASPFTSAW
jgi:thiol-disulfide isomerase/thioredoxin